MRRLVIVPIIHTAWDMGSLAQDLEKAYRACYGDRKWEEHVRAVAQMWRGIERRIDSVRLNWQRASLYQDGLPVCESALEIVTDLARRGSPNHRLLLKLVQRGAKLVGTEDPSLLLEEYGQVKAELGGPGESPGGPAGPPGPKGSQAGGLLDRRDRYIARRIHETLPQGGTGVLFIGLLHRVHAHLSPDVHFDFLIHRLPFERIVT
jgi:hypothetical protein